MGRTIKETYHSYLVSATNNFALNSSALNSSALNSLASHRIIKQLLQKNNSWNPSSLPTILYAII
jgi:hypothetical protein